MKVIRSVVKFVILSSLAATLMSAAPEAVAQVPDPAKLVDQFYPQSLIDAATHAPSVPFDRRSCFTVYDYFINMAPKTIMAAYSNNVSGAIRVIQAQQQGGPYSVIFEPTGVALSGTDCGVTLVDVDGDQINEVEFSFPSFRGINSMDWLFRWDGYKLTNISPVSIEPDGSQSSEFSNIEFLDLYHDGTLQVLSVTGAPVADGSGPVMANDIYRLSGGQFVLDRPIMFYGTYERKTGAPVTVPDSFPLVGGSTGPYVLKIVNGNKDGSKRISSATVVLNGTQVVGANQFSQSVEFISVPVTLNATNQLQVTLAGTPLGTIIITVEDTAAVSSAQQGPTKP